MPTLEQARGWYDAHDPVHGFEHVRRVLRLAERLGEALGADLEILRAAALLHDAADAHPGEGEGRVSHEQASAEFAGKVLRSEGWEETRIAAVQHCIRAHRFRGGEAPESLEAKILFDADKLDALGAIGIARAFAYGGAHQQRLWAPLAEIDLARWEAEGDDPEHHTPVHEFVVKLSRLKERLYTRTGRAIADERHRYMAEFYRRLDAEVGGEL